MLSASPLHPADLLRRLPWPMPALLAWSAGWLAWWAAATCAAPHAAGLLLALLASGMLAWPCQGTWRRLIAAAGFPLSAIVLGPAAGWPAWVWLLFMAPLLAVYPLRAWRDAPLFPTPADALEGLQQLVPVPGRVLDAGCGLGHGLAALQRLWPQARLQGVEWSPLLARLAAWRCPAAHVVRGDMWAQSWSGYDLVYLFQRPESMARAWAKAERELPPGAWLVSLEFAVPGRAAQASLQAPGRRPVWLYAAPGGIQHSTGERQGR